MKKSLSSSYTIKNNWLVPLRSVTLSMFAQQTTIIWSPLKKCTQECKGGKSVWHTVSGWSATAWILCLGLLSYLLKESKILAANANVQFYIVVEGYSNSFYFTKHFPLPLLSILSIIQIWKKYLSKPRPITISSSYQFAAPLN